jgi:sec-independent protein translocase protein TatB
MLDIGWGELLVVIAVAVLVVGPQDIPKVMTTLGRFARRLQYVKFALSQQFEDIMKEHDLQELRNFNDIRAKDANETDEAAADEDMTGEGAKNDDP